MLPCKFSMILSPTFTAAGASIFSDKSSDDGSGGGLLLLSSGLVFGDASSLVTAQR